MTNALRLLAMLALLLVAGTATAKPPTDFDRHVAEGQRSYNEKNYDKAIEELEAAYQLEPDAVLLISIGRCHYLADRPREALSYYNRALQGKLTRSEREEVTSSVAKATIKLQEQERKVSEEQRAAEREKFRELMAQQPQAPQPEQKPIYKRGWFWGTVAGIVVGVGLAVGLGVGLGTRPAPSAGPADVVPPLP